MKAKRWFSLLSVGLMLVLLAGLTQAQQPASTPLGTAFTYQGQLKSDGVPHTGTCDLRFDLWDALTGGTQLGTQTVTNVSVAEGYFTVQLDYGTGAFVGEARWLAVSVRCPAGAGEYTPLTPRQPLTSSPYALYASRAPWSGLTGVPAGFADGVDNDTTYSAGTGLTLSGTTFSADTAYLQRRVSGTCTTGNAIRLINADGTVTCQPVDANAWLLAGNAGTTPGTNFLGTTDDQPLEFKVNGTRALRLQPVVNESGDPSPNLVGGSPANWVTDGVYGATIGGGGALLTANSVTDIGGTVSGGALNRAGDNASGVNNATYATVGGGRINTASGPWATVGGGYGNTASHVDATVGGGVSNSASADYATVGGGLQNVASGVYATVGGGAGNSASAQSATVGGGHFNTASGVAATVGGGNSNAASGAFATVGGGAGNVDSGWYATVGGGNSNAASGDSATVGGGSGNTASDYGATVGGGYTNIVSGTYATVPGGWDNIAQGDSSFAAGHNARALNQGCFVWGDSTDTTHVTCGTDDRWKARASGGVYFYTDAGQTVGSYLPAGGSSWNSISDRTTKENFSPADGQGILETLASLPVQEYNLKSQDDSIRHVGLVAQDFAAFGYGESDQAINMGDVDGVAMAAIQALYAENQELKAKVAGLQQQNTSLDARLTALEQAVHGGKPPQTGARLPIPWLVTGGLVVAGSGALLGLRRRPGGGR